MRKLVFNDVTVGKKKADQSVRNYWGRKVGNHGGNILKKLLLGTSGQRSADQVERYYWGASRSSEIVF